MPLYHSQETLQLQGYMEIHVQEAHHRTITLGRGPRALTLSLDYFKLFLAASEEQAMAHPTVDLTLIRPAVPPTVTQTVFQAAGKRGLTELSLISVNLF